MNRNKLVWGSLKTITTIALAASSISVGYTKDKDCWAEFYADSQYSGDHFRLDGPIKLDNLHSVQGQNWEKRISSLKVGPKAKVTVYENQNFKLTLREMRKYPALLKSLGLTEEDAKEDTELMFDEKSKVHDLSDFNFRNKIRSLKIDCD